MAFDDKPLAPSAVPSIAESSVAGCGLGRLLLPCLGKEEANPKVKSNQTVSESQPNPSEQGWVQLIEETGFAILPNLVEPEFVDELNDAIDALSPDTEETVLERRGQVYAMRHVLDRLPCARDLAATAPLKRLTELLLGPGAFAVRGLLFDKTVEANWGVPWHQDLTIAVRERTDARGYGPWTVKAGVPHVQPPIEVLERMITIRVQLDEGRAEQGPVRVIPGSHRQGRLEAGAIREWLNRVEPTVCLVPRGGALVMSPLLLHASSPASAPGRRRIIHLEYAADPLPSGVAWFESGNLSA